MQNSGPSIFASRPYSWEPGVWARFPWSGLGALLGAVLLTGAAVVVLSLSNGSPIDHWQVMRANIQPQVWVSIFSTIANALLDYALLEGLAITFWKQAGRGVMLQKLHDNYESQSLVSAVATLLRGRLSAVAIACILVAASAVRGPLFQRASTVNNGGLQQLSGQMELQVADFLPMGYFSRETQYSEDIPPELRQAIGNLTRGASYALNGARCSGACTTLVKGVGFGVACESSSYNFSAEEADMAPKVQALGCSSTFGFNNATADRNETFCKELGKTYDVPLAKVFAVGFENGGAAAGSPEDCYRPFKNTLDFLDNNCVGSGINITTTFKDRPTCRGTVQARRCTLRQGVVEYAVMIKNDTISLRHPHWQNDTFLQDTPIDLLDTINHWTKIFPHLYPPIQVNLDRSVRSKAARLHWYQDCPKGYGQSNTSCPVSGSIGERLGSIDLSRQYINEKQAGLNPCDITWSDPMQDIVDGMREFAFRASLDVAALSNRSSLFGRDDIVNNKIPSLTANWAQRVPYAGIQQRTVYNTEWAWAISAVLISFAGILAVLPLYHGWWELGRSVSLNPLEIAKAFGAPLLENVNSNACKSQIVKEVGPERVRYGVVEEKLDHEVSRPLLRVDSDDDGHVETPEPGATFT